MYTLCTPRCTKLLYISFHELHTLHLKNVISVILLTIAANLIIRDHIAKIQKNLLF